MHPRRLLVHALVGGQLVAVLPEVDGAESWTAQIEVEMQKSATWFSVMVNGALHAVQPTD